MKIELKVKVPFIDKNDRTIKFAVGSILVTSDIDRVNNLVSKGWAEIASIKCENDSEAAAEQSGGKAVESTSEPEAESKAKDEEAKAAESVAKTKKGDKK